MKPKHGDLRVWWVPQIPGKSFIIPVASVVEAKQILDTLAEYDLFQFKHRIKPDYCNAGGLSVFDSTDDHDGPDGSWCDWCDGDGEDIDFYELSQLRELDAAGSLPTWCDL